MAPVFLLFLVIFGVLLSFIRWEFALVPFAYIMLCSLIGAAAAIKQRDPWLFVSGPAAIIMHLSYGVGFVSGHLRHLLGHDRVLDGVQHRP